MARGRHSRPGLLARLRHRCGRSAPVAAAPAPTPSLLDLHVEVERLRALLVEQTGRAAAAEACALQAQQQAERLQAQLAGVHDQVARLREELLWAFAEGRVPRARVVDLTTRPARTA